MDPSPVLGQGSLCSTNTSVCPAWAKFGQEQCGGLFKLLGICHCFYPELTELWVKCHSRIKITWAVTALGHLRRFGAQKEPENHCQLNLWMAKMVEERPVRISPVSSTLSLHTGEICICCSEAGAEPCAASPQEGCLELAFYIWLPLSAQPCTPLCKHRARALSSLVPQFPN